MPNPNRKSPLTLPPKRKRYSDGVTCTNVIAFRRQGGEGSLERWRERRRLLPFRSAIPRLLLLGGLGERKRVGIEHSKHGEWMFVWKTIGHRPGPGAFAVHTSAKRVSSPQVNAISVRPPKRTRHQTCIGMPERRCRSTSSTRKCYPDLDQRHLRERQLPWREEMGLAS